MRLRVEDVEPARLLPRVLAGEGVVLQPNVGIERQASWYCHAYVDLPFEQPRLSWKQRVQHERPQLAIHCWCSTHAILAIHGAVGNDQGSRIKVIHAEAHDNIVAATSTVKLACVDRRLKRKHVAPLNLALCCIADAAGDGNLGLDNRKRNCALDCKACIRCNNHEITVGASCYVLLVENQVPKLRFDKVVVSDFVNVCVAQLHGTKVNVCHAGGFVHSSRQALQNISSYAWGSDVDTNHCVDADQIRNWLARNRIFRSNDLKYERVRALYQEIKLQLWTFVDCCIVAGGKRYV